MERERGVLTYDEAATFIGCSPLTLRAWVSKGKSPPFVRVNRLVRFRRCDLDRWLDERTVEPAS